MMADLTACLRPIRVLCLVFGQFYYKLDKDDHFQFSKLPVILMIIYTSLCVAAIATKVQVVASKLKTQLGATSTHIFFTGSYVLQLVNCLIILISHYFNRQIYTDIYGSFKKIDDMLTKLNQRKSLDDVNKSAQRISLAMIISETLFLVIFNMAITARYVSDNEVVTHMVIVFPLLMETNHLICFCTLFYLVERRFGLVNTLIKGEIVSSSAGAQKYPLLPQIFEDKIEALVNLHRALTKSSNMLNHVFSLFLLVTITNILLIVLTYLYTILYMISSSLALRNSVFMFILFKVVLIQVTKLYFITQRCANLTREANISKKLLVGIRIDPDRVSARECIISSCLKLMQSNMEITACKLFSIDNTVVSSIVSAIWSYLFIMTQFRLGDGLHVQNSGNTADDGV